VTTLALDALATGLEATARSDYGTEAAAQLLIGHARWLERPDFRDALVLTDRERCSPPVVWVHWPAVPAFVTTAPCSTSEARILRLAASLAGTNTGRPLADLLSGLDVTNAGLVAGAIAHVLSHGGRRPLAGTADMAGVGR
jgi:hypothetical protein